MEKSVNKEFAKDPFQVECRRFPFEINSVDDVLNSKLLNDFTGERSGFVQVGPKKWFFPSGYERNAEIYYNFQARAADTWVVSFPRSGTTWTQELVWLLSNNLNYEKAQKYPLEARFPFLEFDSFVHPLVKEELLQENEFCNKRTSLVEEITAPVWKTLAQTAEPRFIKTHLPFPLLPPDLLKVGCKVVYVARNPKDVIVSFYHLNRAFRTQGYVGDFESYWHYFKDGLQPWTPYFSHVQEGWSRRNEENILFLFYENMIKDLRGCMLKLSDFLGVDYTSEDYDGLEEYLKIDNFRNNQSVNGEWLKDLGIIRSDEEGFVRKGKSGGWRDYFTEGLNEEADLWIEDNLKRTGIQFPRI